MTTKQSKTSYKQNVDEYKQPIYEYKQPISEYKQQSLEKYINKQHTQDKNNIIETKTPPKNKEESTKKTQQINL